MKIHSAIKILTSGGVGVLPTDTIYGVVASALDKNAVERVYGVRGRDRSKPCIILISSFDDLKIFGVTVDEELKKFLSEQKRPTSFIVSCPEKKWQYLHRGKKSLAFRVPVGGTQRTNKLQQLLKKTGPLIAPSANPAGQDVAQTVEQAHEYFGNDVDFYHDDGYIEGLASQLVDARDGTFHILRA